MRYVATESLKITPNTNSLNPEILFSLHARHSSKYLPIDISGNLAGHDGVIIAKVHQQLSNGSRQSLAAMGVEERDITPYYNFSSTLTESALEYIEEIRHKNKKGDISLKLKLYFKVIISQIPASLSGMQTSQLDLEIIELISDIVIPSSDWTHDFLPAFGKGKYIVLEIPQPDITNGSSLVNEKINIAINSIPKMQKELLSGEWSEVIEKSRPIWELVNEKASDSTPTELHDYLSRSGLSDDAIGHFTKSISELFQFSSKFIHRMDKSGKNINPEIIASKEDAYLIYSLCLNVVNLITCKIKKLNN
jgi:hypothetical protein